MKLIEIKVQLKKRVVNLYLPQNENAEDPMDLLARIFSNQEWKAYSYGQVPCLKVEAHKGEEYEVRGTYAKHRVALVETPGKAPLSDPGVSEAA